jgi:hypothetical protein
MYPRSIRDLPADALVASALQPSDPLSVSQIKKAIAVAPEPPAIAPWTTS